MAKSVRMGGFRWRSERGPHRAGAKAGESVGLILNETPKRFSLCINAAAPTGLDSEMPEQKETNRGKAGQQ